MSTSATFMLKLTTAKDKARSKFWLQLITAVKVFDNETAVPLPQQKTNTLAPEITGDHGRNPDPDPDRDPDRASGHGGVGRGRARAVAVTVAVTVTVAVAVAADGPVAVAVVTRS